MPHLTARLLCGCAFFDANADEIKLPTRKAQALLAYLALQPDEWQSRERLAALLWSDRGEPQARHSLNQALHAIRRLGGSVLEGDTARVRLLARAVKVDVNDLRHSLDTAPAVTADKYVGPLLDGFTIPDPAFEEWVGSERRCLHEEVCSALRRWLSEAIDNGEVELGARVCKRLLELEPFDEATTRELMRFHAAAGNRAEALRVYQRCEALLKEEFGVAPSDETKSVFEKVSRTVEPGNTVIAQSLLFPPAPHDDLRIQGRPILAVLPFRNLSDDPDHAFFAEGLSEELIFALSAFRWFSVLGRNSSFLFGGSNVDPRRAGSELGARYVLDGSVRKYGTKISIIASLLDATTGEQLWTERYQRNVDSLFEIQDDITQKIVAATEANLDDVEMHRAMAKPSSSLEAYEHVQRGNWLLAKGWAFSDDDPLAIAEQHFEEAVVLDQHYALAIASLSNIRYRRAQMAQDRDVFQDSLTVADEFAQKALLLAPDDPRVLRYASQISMYVDRQQEALDTINQALKICPSYASAYSGLAFTLSFIGRFDEALPAADETVRLRPYDRTLYRCIMSKSIAHYQTMSYAEAEAVARQSLNVNPAWSLNNLLLVAALGQMGRTEEAAEPAARLREMFPQTDADYLVAMLPFAKNQSREHLVGGLRKGGWGD